MWYCFRHNDISLIQDLNFQVTFSTIPYHEVISRRKKQDEVSYFESYKSVSHTFDVVFGPNLFRPVKHIFIHLYVFLDIF